MIEAEVNNQISVKTLLFDGLKSHRCLSSVNEKSYFIEELAHLLLSIFYKRTNSKRHSEHIFFKFWHSIRDIIESTNNEEEEIITRIIDYLEKLPEKEFTFESENLPLENSSTPTSITMSFKNKKKEQQDRNFSIYDLRIFFKSKEKREVAPKISLFSVFDGHNGSAVANYFSVHLPYHFAQNLETNFNSYDAETLIKCLNSSIEKLNEECIKNSFMKYCGSVLTTLIITSEFIITVWIGDCAAVLKTTEKMKVLTAYLHNFSNEDERRRTIDSGGRISQDTLGTYRLSGKLAVSRAVGDSFLKPHLSSEPSHLIYERTGTYLALYIYSSYSLFQNYNFPFTIINYTNCFLLHPSWILIQFPYNLDQDRYILVGSDGLWDSFSDYAEVCKICDELLQQSELTRSEVVRSLITNRVNTDVEDNITAMMIFL